MDRILILLKIQAEAVQAAAAKKLAKKRASQAGCHVKFPLTCCEIKEWWSKGCGRWLALWRQRQRQGEDAQNAPLDDPPVDLNTVLKAFDQAHKHKCNRTGRWKLLATTRMTTWVSECFQAWSYCDCGWPFASKILDFLCVGVRLLGSEIGNFAPQKAVEHKELKADETWICHMGQGVLVFPTTNDEHLGCFGGATI